MEGTFGKHPPLNRYLDRLLDFGGRLFFFFIALVLTFLTGVALPILALQAFVTMNRALAKEARADIKSLYKSIRDAFRIAFKSTDDV